MDQSKSSNITETKEKIHNLLAQAEAEKGKDILKALSTLEEIKKLIPELNADKDDKQSVRNASNNKLEHEIQYLQKRANIYYEIEDYDHAETNYREIKKLLPNISKVYKAIGDCHRKKGEYDKAAKEYNEGIARIDADDYAEPTDKAEILNSVALLHLQKNDFNSAIKVLDEAINIANDNPLYYCNKGNVLYTKGDHNTAMECFKTAQELAKSDRPAKGLTKENFNYIDKSLSKLFDHMKAMDSISLKKVDDFMAKRQNRFIAKVVENLTSLRDSKAQDKEVEQLLSTKEKVSKIQNDPDLNCYYDGFLGTLSQSYHTAVIVNSGQVQKDTSNTIVDIASKLISFIPFCGDTASSLLSAGSDFIMDARLTKAANNVWKFTTTASQFDEIAQDVVADVVIKRQDQIRNLKVEEYVLPRWLSRFDNLFKTAKVALEKVNVTLYGERWEDPLQKLGFQSASDLVSKNIATGTIYEGKVSARISPDEKRMKLIKLALELVDRDIEHSAKGKDYVPPKEEPISAVTTNNDNSPLKKNADSSPSKDSSPTKKSPKKKGFLCF